MSTVAIAIALALGPGAGAAQIAAAKTLASQGAQEYVAGHYEEAVRDLKASYDVLQEPILLYNLGQCERARGHIEEAIGYYRAYLKAAPNAPNVAAAKKKLQEALDAKARPVPGGGLHGIPPPVASTPAPPPRSPLPAPSDIAPQTPAEAAQVQPPPAPPPVEPAPAGAVTESPEPASHSHWLGATLIAAAVVCAGFAVYGAVQVVQYDQTSKAAATWPQYNQLVAQQSNAQTWEYAAIGLGIAAAGVGTGAIFAW
jgi:tetratricopeptide (TPR) repeat protein